MVPCSSAGRPSSPSSFMLCVNRCAGRNAPLAMPPSFQGDAPLRPATGARALPPALCRQSAGAHPSGKFLLVVSCLEPEMTPQCLRNRALPLAPPAQTPQRALASPRTALLLPDPNFLTSGRLLGTGTQEKRNRTTQVLTKRAQGVQKTARTDPAAALPPPRPGPGRWVTAAGRAGGRCAGAPACSW